MDERDAYGAWMARFGFCAGMLFGAWTYNKVGWTGVIVVAVTNLVFSVAVVVIQTIRGLD